MPKKIFPDINYEYKRYINGSCPLHDFECIYYLLSGKQRENNYIDVTADIWNTLNTNIYPELCSEFVNEKKYSPNGVSLAISGGGSRSFTGAIGYIRALLELEIIPGKNAFNLSQYISSVSGGSWFTGTYLMAKGTNDYSDLDLLGLNIEISNINYTTLNNINFNNNNNFMGKSVCDAPIIKYMLEGLTKGIKFNFLWNYAIGKIFLERYNLFGKITCQNEYYSNLIKLKNLNNPNFNSQIIIPPKNSPFWICNASLLDPNIINNGATAVQFTPYYSGFPQILGNNNNLVGGFWTETYAFGCLSPKLNEFLCKPTSTQVKIPKFQGGPLTLENMIGTSSTVYAYIDYEISQKFFSKTARLDPIYNLWSPPNPNQNKLIYMGDGGLCNDTGILNLVSRNCKFIIAFNSFSFGTSPNYNFCNSALLELFGLYNENNCVSKKNPPNRDSVQIFNSEDWQNMENQFISTYESGGPSYARSKLNVLFNKQNSVLGNYELDLLIISLQSSSKFNSQLPSNISDTFNDSSGPFPNFPYYSTIAEDPNKLIQLTQSQVNLLQCFTYWSIMSNNNLKSEIIDMYLKANIF